MQFIKGQQVGFSMYTIGSMQEWYMPHKSLGTRLCDVGSSIDATIISGSSAFSLALSLSIFLHKCTQEVVCMYVSHDTSI